MALDDSIMDGESPRPKMSKVFGTIGSSTKFAIYVAFVLLLLQILEFTSSAEGSIEEEEEQIFHYGVFLMILLVKGSLSVPLGLRILIVLVSLTSTMPLLSKQASAGE